MKAHLGLLVTGISACLALAGITAWPPAAPTAAASSPDSAEAPHVCPMHPQIVQKGPGACPICGMDLVEKPAAPAAPTADPAETPHVCPMHPQIVQKGPGACPVCGMDLVPKPGDAPGSQPAGGGLRIDPTVVQNMGVRFARVNRSTLSRNIRTVGAVKVADDRQSVVNLRFSGWIEKLHVDVAGERVERGQALFEVYSPELVSAQQEYVVARRTAGADSALAKSARRRLELFGVSGGEIRRVERRGPSGRVTVRAPRAGHVLTLSVTEGARVVAGADLYRIADLERVWIEADVYEHDSPWIRVGAAAKAALSFPGSDAVDARVDYIYPTLNPRTRTVRVRMVLDNPDLTLKPGAFATVEIEAERRPDVLVVPSEAVLRSGMRQLVFVALGEGRFEPREVQTGLVGSAHRVEVRDGLREGERVVASGQFLLDSESQLQEAVQKMLDAQAGGHDHGDAGDPAGDPKWTCPMHPQIVEAASGACPVCGMDLVESPR
jgi:Cu(I)/Ag(I) efflux system membrane fusion protein/cobalt-zinc-cadmium efflux system membrane fusion protein